MTVQQGADGPPCLVLHPVKAEAGARLRLRAFCRNGGKGRVQWANKERAGESQPFTLAAAVWEEVEVALTDIVGKATIVRVYLPAKDQPVEVAWIELRDGSQTRRWEFFNP
jgi:hypothetical protein